MKEELNSEQLHMKAHFSFISLITLVGFRPKSHAELLGLNCIFSASFLLWWFPFHMGLSHI